MSSPDSITSRGGFTDRDRIKGSAHEAKGAVKEAAGKLTGDTKLNAEGNIGKNAGKVEGAVGKAKDTARGRCEVELG
jgi:uncharacterized protein YjbJ (UPF0337 family)